MKAVTLSDKQIHSLSTNFFSFPSCNFTVLFDSPHQHWYQMQQADFLSKIA